MHGVRKDTLGFVILDDKSKGSLYFGASQTRTGIPVLTIPVKAHLYYEFVLALTENSTLQCDGEYVHSGNTTLLHSPENSDWIAANDPCTQLLGAGWRMPTYSEWVTVGSNAAFGSTALSYTSVLKLHGAGFSFSGSTFVLSSRGYNLSTWSSTQADASTAWEASDQGGHQPILYNVTKSCAMTLRCLR